MVKITYCLEKFPPEYTGAGTRALKQSRRLTSKFNHQISIVCLSQGSLPEVIEEKKFNITRLKCPTSEKAIIFPFHLFSVLIKTFFYLLKNKDNSEILHLISYTWPNRAITLWNWLFFGKKTILDVTLQGQDDPITLLNDGLKNRIFSPITKMLLKKIDLFIVASQDAKDSCIAAGIAENKIFFEPHPCDEYEFESISLKDKIKLRNKLGLPLNRFILLSVGRVQERKNQLAMAKAIAKTGRKDIMLVLIGPADTSDSYVNQIIDVFEKNGIKKNILIAGIKKNVNEYMIASDAYIITSKSEGFPTSVSEAIVSGLPVISSYSGPTDFFISGDRQKNGILIKLNPKSTIEDESELLCSAIMQIKSGKYKTARNKIRNYGMKNLSSSTLDKILSNKYKQLIQK